MRNDEPGRPSTGRPAALLAVRIGRADVGRRVTLRHRYDATTLTDVVGRLDAWDDGVLRVERRDGRLVEVPEADVVAAKVVAPEVSAEDMQAVAERGWPPHETAPLGEWTLRWSGGVTGRANSVRVAGIARDAAAGGARRRRAVVRRARRPGADADARAVGVRRCARGGRMGGRPDGRCCARRRPQVLLDAAARPPAEDLHVVAHGRALARAARAGRPRPRSRRARAHPHRAGGARVRRGPRPAGRAARHRAGERDERRLRPLGRGDEHRHGARGARRRGIATPGDGASSRAGRWSTTAPAPTCSRSGPTSPPARSTRASGCRCTTPTSTAPRRRTRCRRTEPGSGAVEDTPGG